MYLTILPKMDGPASDMYTFLSFPKDSPFINSNELNAYCHILSELFQPCGITNLKYAY
jgi:hypothetical protein